ncbi:succinylglutamate desuccinylase/aspartoacylase family protein [Mesorhizobium sp. B4-1-4]|uniref:succinylglutamate desuccinylase/aspartoacylase family protein n=1 Tax=Mesorhizobium sp. B4-1-4 TaxID=2589888 RepID=UPI001126C818|nr:succinylglutamate desuccinylase/aspartoacylase family protein [Mesorhizobium sp. B4-1-4]UCI31772.1 succinylglutamate desuccinylase/aspartoacylase family protein [Mesorhizobium sp. B4-1-4]
MIIDFDLHQEGKHSGYIRVPHSTDESAYGSILIPVISIRNGEGPRVLCLGAVHGDEFEGQIAWTKLAQRFEVEDVRGHVLIIPALNVPAALVGSRVSPVDQVNLNRCFPGNPRGTLTERIAHIVESDLLPLFELVIDIHSGGNSLLYLPGPTITLDPDPVAQSQMVEILKAFGAKTAYVFDESGGGDAALIGACRRIGIRRLGSEIGGGGITSRDNIAMTQAGILRVLVHLGAISSRWIDGLPEPQMPALIRRASPRSTHYVHADASGVFEPFVELGEEVRTDQKLGQILFPETPWRDPVACMSRASGIVICRRAKGRTTRGDGIIVLGERILAG